MSPRRRCAVRSPAGRRSSVSARGSRTRCSRSCIAIWCPGRRWLTCSGSRAAAGWRIGRFRSMRSSRSRRRQLDFHGQELRIIDASLGRIGLEREEVKRLMTIPGVDATVALSIVAAVGEFHRFSGPERLVCYLGLNPRVRQSGGQPASHGRITSTVARTRAGCSSRQPGSRSRPRVRCGRSMSGSDRGGGCRSPLSRPPASSRCCAGIW